MGIAEPRLKLPGPRFCLWRVGGPLQPRRLSVAGSQTRPVGIRKIVDLVRLAAFDLDGTLLRGETVCEAIARGIGRIHRMREFERLDSNQIEEVTAAREEMAAWYSSFTLEELCKHLTGIRVAPGVDEGFALLREHDFKIAIVSITWEFAVEWFANKFGADYSIGTRFSSGGLITHFWPQDKALLADTTGRQPRCRNAQRGRRGRFKRGHTHAFVL